MNGRVAKALKRGDKVICNMKEQGYVIDLPVLAAKGWR